MRFLSFFAFACATFQAASAIPVSNPTNDLVACDDLYMVSSRNAQFLEARRDKWKPQVSKKPKPAPGPHITFSKEKSPHEAHHALNNLNLHSKKRKAVEDYHKKLVAEHMKTIPGAHSAVIVNLAHAIGSRDPNIHISTIIRGKDGDSIYAPRHGNPNQLDPKHHIYTNKEKPNDGYKGLPIEYKKAVDKKLIREGKEPGRA